MAAPNLRMNSCAVVAAHGVDSGTFGRLIQSGSWRVRSIAAPLCRRRSVYTRREALEHHGVVCAIVESKVDDQDLAVSNGLSRITHGPHQRFASSTALVEPAALGPGEAWI